MRIQNARSFTMLEIMVALVIVMGLTVVAVPVMKNFITQSRIADVISSTAELQARVGREIAANESVTNSGVGISAPSNLNRHVQTFSVSNDGVISVTTTTNAGGVTFTLTPTYTSSNETISWVCAASSSAFNEAVPRSCRV